MLALNLPSGREHSVATMANLIQRRRYMGNMGSDLGRDRRGQSLLETALLLPLLLTIVFNAVNIGYFFLICLNLTVAPRQGAQYSIQGPAGQSQLQLPGAASVGSLISESFTGAVGSASSTNTSIRVCSAALGLNNLGQSNQMPNCQVTYGSGVFPGLTAADADPEAPFMVLNRVDIQYTVTPLIQGAAFNLALPSPLTFQRTIYMRVEE
jgi:Flp pilus assembly protein TadG